MPTLQLHYDEAEVATRAAEYAAWVNEASAMFAAQEARRIADATRRAATCPVCADPASAPAQPANAYLPVPGLQDMCDDCRANYAPY